MRSDEEGEGKKFKLQRSVFKTWKEDTEESLKRMFDLDMKYAKISKIMKKDPDQYQLLKE